MSCCAFLLQTEIEKFILFIYAKDIKNHQKVTKISNKNFKALWDRTMKLNNKDQDRQRDRTWRRNRPDKSLCRTNKEST